LTDVMKLRNSERGSWKTCRWRWSWTYRDGLQAREAPHALRFGDLIHRSLAPYYKPGLKRGPAPAATFERLFTEQAAKLGNEGFDVWSDDKWADALPLGIGMLEGYVERFKEADAEYEILSSEQTFQRRIRAQRPVGAPASFPNIIAFTIVGTLDGVWRHRRTGRIIFKEFKTAASISEDGLAMDEQPSLYWTYGPKWLERRGLIPPDTDLREILYTFLRKAIPNDDRPTNADGLYLNKPSKEALRDRCTELGLEWSKSAKVEDLMLLIRATGEDPDQLGEIAKSQPAPYFHRVPVHRDRSDLQSLHRRVCQEAFEIYAARRGQMSIYKNPGPLHMPNCRGCAVRDACEVHEAGGDYQSVLDATTARWNPYAAHELPERS
jgi:hypothetical protein